MLKILIGLLLVTLDVTMAWGNMIISLLPDFVGFVLLLMGQREIAFENEHFGKNVKFCLWCATVALMVFIMDLLGFSATVSGGIQALLLQLLLQVLEAVCLFRIVRGVQAADREYDLDAKSKLFFIIWLALTAVSSLSLLLGWIELLGKILGLVQAGLAFAFVILFFNFKCAYEELPAAPRQEE